VKFKEQYSKVEDHKLKFSICKVEIEHCQQKFDLEIISSSLLIIPISSDSHTTQILFEKAF
jgi:hypothetical protein